jgi:hypothetical protein
LVGSGQRANDWLESGISYLVRADGFANNNGYNSEEWFFYAVCAEGYTSGTTFGAYFSCVEAGSNTSTVALRVVGGDEKGSLESETVKYGQKSHGTRTRE